MVMQPEDDECGAVELAQENQAYDVSRWLQWYISAEEKLMPLKYTAQTEQIQQECI